MEFADGLAPLPDPTALPRVLNREDAITRGFSPRAIEHRVAIGRWQRVLPHTYLTTDTLTWTDRLRAALAFAGPKSLLSGAAALADEGMRSVQRPSRILVLVPRSTAVHSTRWVQIRRTDRLPEPALLPGPRRAPLSRAVADLALERRRLDDVRALIAEAVRRDLCTIDELADELRCGPRRWSAFLRQAVDEVSGGAWSAPEARAATLLKRAGLPPFEQNARIELSNGRYVIADFLWRALRAVLEIDSDSHHALAGDADGTSEKHLWLEIDGYSVIHRTPRFVIGRPATFTADVGRWLGGRATMLGRS